jgi:hypothetical protein
MAWIRTVDVEEAEGPLRAHYDAAIKRAGRVYGVVRLMSLDPVILQSSMGLYMATTTRPRSPLPRWFRELVGVTVSRLNDCFY